MKGKGKPDPKAAPPVAAAPVVVDPTPGELMRRYVDQRVKERSDLTEFSHAKYSDWLHYFGFSLEREHLWAQSVRPSKSSSMRRAVSTGSVVSLSPPRERPAGGAAAAAATVLPPLTVGAGGPASPPRKDAAQTSSPPPSASGAKDRGQDPFQSAPLSVDVGRAVGLDFGPVDARVVSVVGPMPDCRSYAAVADALAAPYRTVTWRLSAYRCAHYKLRSIVRWAGEFIQLQLPSQAASAAAAAPKVGFGDGKPPKPGAKGNKGDAKDAAKEPAASDLAGSDAVMALRVADPLALATLVADMCAAVGVACKVVKGTLKGSLDSLQKPVGFMPWAWNMATVNDDDGTPRQYLIDAFLCHAHVGPKAGITPQVAPAAAAAAAPDANGAAAAAAPPLAAPTSSFAAPIFESVPDLAKIFDAFYYFTDPRQFAALHFPDDTGDLLLTRTISRTSWEVYPRLPSPFFLWSMRLDSHRRRCVFTAKSTPVYVSLYLDNIAHVELCAVVTRDTPAGSQPIDPRFVWTQRQERERRQTFSIMTPDVGYYSILIGAREIRPDAPTTDLPAAPFVPVVHYQVNVTFVNMNEPMFPRQLLSPSFCKLVEPLSHKVRVGTQRFVVVPTTSRVFAVAVVNRVLKPPLPPPAPGMPVAPSPPPPATPAAPAPKAAAGAKKGAAPEAPSPPPAAPAPPKPEYERVDMQLLPLNTEKAYFEGDVALSIGTVEIWALVGDPTSLCVRSAKRSDVAAPAPAPAVGEPPVADPAASPRPAAPPPPPPTKVRGNFHIAVADIAVVKRIPPKELALNDGKPLIQPAINAEADLPYVLRLLSGATDTGVGWTEEARELVGKPLRAVGTYFSPSLPPA